MRRVVKLTFERKVRNGAEPPLPLSSRRRGDLDQTGVPLEEAFPRVLDHPTSPFARYPVRYFEEDTSLCELRKQPILRAFLDDAGFRADILEGAACTNHSLPLME